MAPLRHRFASGMRVGADLVEVSAVARTVRDFGARYLQRIYTAGELAYCQAAATDPAPHLAARFAAKEATVKVLRPRPEDEGIDWRSIEVVRCDGGWCRIALHGAASRLGGRAGLHNFEVSLSHAEQYALAVVVAASADTGGAEQ